MFKNNVPIVACNNILAAQNNLGIMEEHFYKKSFLKGVESVEGGHFLFTEVQFHWITRTDKHFLLASSYNVCKLVRTEQLPTMDLLSWLEMFWEGLNKDWADM